MSTQEAATNLAATRNKNAVENERFVAVQYTNYSLQGGTNGVQNADTPWGVRRELFFNDQWNLVRYVYDLSE